MERKFIKDCRVGDFILARHPSKNQRFQREGRQFFIAEQTIRIGDRQGHRKIVVREA